MELVHRHLANLCLNEVLVNSQQVMQIVLKFHFIKSLQTELSILLLEMISKEVVGTWIITFCRCITLDWAPNHDY